MAERPRSPLDDLAGMFPGLDSEAATRMVAEVQRLGLDTARTVIERFSELAGEWPLAPRPSSRRDGDPEPPSAAPAGSKNGPEGQLRADTERAVDAYLNVVRRMYDVVTDLAGGRATPGEDRWMEPLRLPPASPGGTTSAYAWLHNTTAEAADLLIPRCAFLMDHAGHHLSGAAVSFDPAQVTQLGPAASRQLLATLRVPDDAIPGTYHGLVLVEHLPDLALPIVAEVRPLEPDGRR